MKLRQDDLTTHGRPGAVVLLIIFVLCGVSFAAESTLPQATAVYGVIATDPIYLWIAQDKGFFKKNSVNIDLTHIPTNQAVQALVGGKVQFATAGPQILEANLAGSDTVYIMSPVNSFVFSLYSKPEIANIKALYGKTIGATNKGTPTDIAGHMLLAQNGLKPDVDVKFVYLKEIPALVAALQQGVIDAALLPPPSTLTARNFGLKELLNITALKIPFVQHSIGATRSYINAHQDLVRRFVRGAVEGLDYLRKNRADAVAIMSKYTKITDQAQLNEALDSYDKAWEKIPMPSQSAIEAVLASSENPKAKGAKWDQFVDDRFIKELIASGIFR
ncbi:MAG TPA: ABC transporter substrate-binding protein [Candidatus Limnocylindrales bacterium]|nr:ABC transporter substrate-binding protein [Candidatus Limnocylindrales bacterium]